MTPADRPAITITRRVEWGDTDAAGHHHHSAVLRWAEAAEAELLREYGQDELFGRTPRVHYEASYRERLWFGQVVWIDFEIAGMTERSMCYEFTVRSDSGIAATGKMVVAYAAADSPRAVPWPDEVRAALDVSQFA